jgi:electron transport complex protein RnfD
MLNLSVSPHIHSKESVERSMRSVLMALLPALAASVYFFGPRSLLIEAVSVLSAILSEAFIQFLMKKPVTISDGSAAVTGLLLAFNMPPGIPLYVPVVGSAFGIIVVKQLFGGLGNNIFNPALAARVFVMFAWLPEMTHGACPRTRPGSRP